ncbi:MAG: hypothetical protein HC888_06935 [Candidatus Competibacteraceae bacterium]|nr:hypothetical protein [Candidatus Competibacteraceae bacterium]
MREAINSNKYVQVLIFALAVIFSATMFARFFEQFPTEGTTLGIDWIHYAIKNGTIRYDITRWAAKCPLEYFAYLVAWILPENPHGAF